MSRKLALKRLTGSDLTLFEWQFRNLKKGNQKSINLNANVFVKDLYPLLPELADERGGRLPLDLSIFGPGYNYLDNLQRKIIKGGTYKNWRLNGEFIHNRPETPNRYNSLAEGDYALFEFYGIEYPTAAKLLLVSQNVAEDIELFNALNTLSEGKSMITIGEAQLEELILGLTEDDRHPVNEFVIGKALEEIIVTGGDVNQNEIVSKPSLKKISLADFQKAKKTAEINGKRGEEFVNDYFEKLLERSEIAQFTWESNANPISPYDFVYTNNDGNTIHVDVKSTSGPFDNVIHISYNELLQMSIADRYDIYRVYFINEGVARLRISQGLKDWALGILTVLNSLPEGIKSDGISLKPSKIVFETEILLKISVET